MSGIIIRSNSEAMIRDTTLQNTKIFGIAVSDSKEVSIRDSVIIGSGHSAVACYNNSKVVIQGTSLISGRVGVNVFTGGMVNVSDSTVMGMSECAAWIHKAGSGYFEKVVIDADPVTSDLDIAELAKRSLEPKKEEIDPGSVFKIETKRFFGCTESVIVGVGAYSLVCNAEASEVPVGIEAVRGKCKVCGRDPSGAYFTRCGHTLYCKECWNSLDPKDEACELCLMPVTGVVGAINCSCEGEEDTCSICFGSPSDSVILPCGHTICWECASRWFASSTECPFCREKNARPQRYVSYE
jgi:hypothetical protein